MAWWQYVAVQTEQPVQWLLDICAIPAVPGSDHVCHSQCMAAHMAQARSDVSTDCRRTLMPMHASTECAHVATQHLNTNSACSLLALLTSRCHQPETVNTLKLSESTIMSVLGVDYGKRLLLLSHAP